MLLDLGGQDVMLTLYVSNIKKSSGWTTHENAASDAA